MLQVAEAVITVDLRRVPADVCAVYFIATVADAERTFADVKTARCRLVDWTTGVELCRYYPASARARGSKARQRALRA